MGNYIARRFAALGTAACFLLAAPALGQTNWGVVARGADFYVTDLTRGQILRGP